MVSYTLEMFEEGSSEHHTHSSAAEWSETLSGWRLTLWCHAAQRKVWMEVNISDRQAGVMRISLYIFYNFIFCFTTPSARLSWIYCIYHTLVHPPPISPSPLCPSIFLAILCKERLFTGRAHHPCTVLWCSRGRAGSWDLIGGCGMKVMISEWSEDHN